MRSQQQSPATEETRRKHGSNNSQRGSLFLFCLTHPCFIRVSSVALFLSCLLSPQVVGAADSKRPNILFAFAYDWGRYASIFAMADGPGSINDVIKTPNIDRIAREGVLFRRAYVNAPSCTPCRSSLLSGQY